MDLSLTELLADSSKLKDVSEDYVLNKISEEPFVQGWKIVLSKLQGLQKSNASFYNSDSFFAKDYLKEIPAPDLKISSNTEVTNFEKDSFVIDENEIIHSEKENDELKITDDIDPISEIGDKNEEKKSKSKKKKTKKIKPVDFSKEKKNKKTDDSKKKKAKEDIKTSELVDSSKKAIPIESESNVSTKKKKPKKGKSSASKSEAKKKKKSQKKTKVKKSVSKNVEVTNFESWLRTLSPLDELKTQRKKAKKAKSKKKKKHKQHLLAKKSVKKKKALISEPLAELYLSQGHKNRAIAMYQQLSLVFPEKSAYFAAKISEINNLD